ncbi:DUF3392 domain-containing protein [Litorilituus lipolyticus]|uniref:DUF3392 domain-containing protein n=1 Tax=Litorilituus lipolyticus TaxID=2491017 RepID=A0A502L2P6_9GAMM|nr:DUF3392 domain-containing protein [Litorilituus lipolyticus]TPH14637.1 DUF3392 domain-containing protein [Litorilituus lipolyticus]
MPVVLIEFLTDLGHWFRPYQYQAALAMIATLLVIFGNEINNAVKSLVAKQHFMVRTLVFVLVCAFGYGLITVWLTSLLAAQLAKVPTVYIVPVVFLAFFCMGMYAQKQRHI